MGFVLSAITNNLILQVVKNDLITITQSIFPLFDDEFFITSRLIRICNSFTLKSEKIFLNEATIPFHSIPF